MKLRSTIVVLLMAVIAVGLSGCFQTPGPLAKFTVTPEIRAGYPPFEPTFDASASSSPNGAIVSYEWDFGDGETGTGVVVTHTYEEKGIYEVTLIVTDSTGETGARSLAVEALNRVPIASFEVNIYWVAIGNPIEFDASASYDTDGEIVQYLWSFGDGTTGESMVVEHSYASQNGGSWQPQVTLTVVDEDGGIGTTSRRINVVGCDSCG
jgi:PKD repeat protein